MKDFDINKLAEQIMTTGAVSPSTHTPPIFETKDSSPDISHIEVPDDYVQSLLNLKAEPINEEVTNSKVVTEAKVISLISELSTMIKKAKGIIEELTSCGAIGTGPGKPMGKKKGKSYGYSKSSKTS